MLVSCADPTRLARATGVEPDDDLDAMVAAAWRWLQANPRGYGPVGRACPPPWRCRSEQARRAYIPASMRRVLRRTMAMMVPWGFTPGLVGRMLASWTRMLSYPCRRP